MDYKYNYQIKVSAKDQFSSVLNELEKRMGKVGTSVDQAQNKVTRFGQSCKEITNAEIANFITVLDQATRAFRSMGTSGAGFEQNLANLSATTGIAGKNLDELGSLARRIGQDSGIGATAAAEAFNQLASQIQFNKIGLEGLKTLQQETITLAQATGLGMAEAATVMATAINQFGLDTSEANRVINVLAAGAKLGTANVTDLEQSLRIAGKTASTAGLSVEQTAGALEVLSQNNLKGAEAGTTLRDILQKLQENLNGDLGEIGLTTALEALQSKLNDTAYLSKLFGEENVASAQYLIANAGAVNQMTQAITGTSVAQEQAAIRTNTVAEKMKQMQAIIDNTKIAFFDLSGALAPYAVVMGEVLPAIASFTSIMQFSSQVTRTLHASVQLFTQSTLAKTAVEKASIAVTSALTAAQTALNAVMNANPVALVVLAIAGLVAGLVVAYNQSEQFRRIVDGLWKNIQQLATVIWDHLVKAFDFLATAIRKAWDQLKSLLGLSGETVAAQEETADATGQVAGAYRQAAAATDLFNTSIGEQAERLNTNLSTLGGMENKISALKKAQKEASLEQAVALEREIRLWEKKQEEMQNALRIGAAQAPAMVPLGVSLPGVDRGKGPQTDPESGLLQLAPDLEKFDPETLDNVEEDLKQRMERLQKYASITGEQIVSGLSNSVAGLAESLGGALATGDWGEQMKNFLVGLMDMLQQFAAALIATGTAALAFKGIFANPIAGIIAGTALMVATAAAKAALQNATAFADGGIVSGPTLALVGEYAGASRNPEVIAPLDKLRSLIHPAADSLSGLRLETKVRGKDLYVALRSTEHEMNRTR